MNQDLWASLRYFHERREVDIDHFSANGNVFKKILFSRQPSFALLKECKSKKKEKEQATQQKE